MNDRLRRQCLHIIVKKEIGSNDELSHILDCMSFAAQTFKGTRSVYLLFGIMDLLNNASLENLIVDDVNATRHELLIAAFRQADWSHLTNDEAFVRSFGDLYTVRINNIFRDNLSDVERIKYVPLVKEVRKKLIRLRFKDAYIFGIRHESDIKQIELYFRMHTLTTNFVLQLPREIALERSYIENGMGMCVEMLKNEEIPSAWSVRIIIALLTSFFDNFSYLSDDGQKLIFENEPLFQAKMSVQTAAEQEALNPEATLLMAKLNNAIQLAREADEKATAAKYAKESKLLTESKARQKLARKLMKRL